MLRLMTLFGFFATVSAVTAIVAADKPANKPFDDATFVAKAASGGMHEVELGKLAVKNATRADVKEFAQKMVDDHTAANADLKKAALAAGLTVPEKMNEKDQQETDKYKDLQGAEFDKAYIAHMIKDHEMDVKEFKAASHHAKDAGIKETAAKILKTVEEHLEMIKKISEK